MIPFANFLQFFLRAIAGGLFVFGASVFGREATPIDRIRVKEGFEVERLYSVLRDRFGSWVTLCKDDKGRLIAGDQNGGLYRFEPPQPGGKLKGSDIQKIDADIGYAWGLLYAFDSLYVMVNGNKRQTSGLYRLKDTNGDDQFDEVKLLRGFPGTQGEHGLHAIVLSPDKKSLYIAAGNSAPMPEYSKTRVPPVWGEDTLQPRLEGRSFMLGATAPKGWVCKVDPDGKNWELVSTGFRNQYDLAFNHHGELFTHDSDMEWDKGAAWYRPTRVNHIISGSEFGWRSCSAKWPEYYSDSFGAVVETGPGSPTGMVFGHGAKFPAKYQKALFLSDWSYGRMYATHLTPKGSTYTATVEEIISGQPLPIADVVIGDDGAMYFVVGGRRVQSGVYRMTYTGGESTKPAVFDQTNQEERDLRHKIELAHLEPNAESLEKAWGLLGSEDRALRYAARTAIEKVPVDDWDPRAFAESDSFGHLGALLSLARVGEKKHQAGAVSALLKKKYEELSLQERLDLIRAYALTFVRLGEPTEAQKAGVIAQLGPQFPAGTKEENIELSDLLGYLKDPGLAEKAVARLMEKPGQEEEISIAKNIRFLKVGWSEASLQQFFKWFVRSSQFSGGKALKLFIEDIQEDVMDGLPKDSQEEFKKVLKEAEKLKGKPREIKPLGFVKNWKMNDLQPLLAVGLEGGRNFENGQDMFASGSCYICHRFQGEGGAIGPDLTSARGKFSPYDLLESIVHPSKEISDQYNTMVFELKDGKKIVGRIANLRGDHYMVSANPSEPANLTRIEADEVKSIEPSPVSSMPPGLINGMKDEDVLDLLAYLLSGGDQEDPLFNK